MTDRDEALNRLRATNPVPGIELIDPDEISRVVALCEERRLTPDARPTLEPLAPPRRKLARPALAFAAAFAAVIAIVGVFSLLGRGGQSFIDEPPSPTSLPVVTTTAAPAPSAVWGLSSVWIHDVAAGSDGSVWAATNAGLIRWLPGVDEPSVYTTDDGLPFDDVQNIAMAQDGTVWAGGDGWIAHLDENRSPNWDVHPAEDSFGPMAVGPDGSVWSVAGLDRLMRFDGTDWETITVPDLPGNDSPWSFSLAVAPDGTVWAGTNDHRGVVSYDGTDFAYYEMWDGIPDQSAATVAVAPDGTVWAGGDIAGDDPGGGVASFDGTEWTQYTTEDGLLTMSARVAIGPDGTVWTIHYGPDGGEDGVSRFDGTSWTAFPDVPAPGFPAAVDTSGTLWAPTDDNSFIFSFDGTDTTVLKLPTLKPTAAEPIPDSSAGDQAPQRTIQSSDDWDPILTERSARRSPTAASCADGSNPDAPGPAGQDRPQPDEYSNQAADFDRVWGRVVLIDHRRNTWTLDVCTNTWHEMDADGVLPGTGSLVYDVDSDRSILFSEGLVWVYDRDRNIWERRDGPQSSSDGWSSLAAFYDPVSGLIVSIRGDELEGNLRHFFSAYDVDADEWTTIGSVTPSEYAPVIGYSHDADRIITAGVFSKFGTDLIDPRTGVVELVEQDHPEFVGGFGYSELANGANTAYALSMGSDGFDNMVCGFDAETSGWKCLPNVPPRGHYAPYDAITYDWINDRLVFIGGAIHPWSDGAIKYFDDVWSLDPETSEWLELVPSSIDDS